MVREKKAFLLIGSPTCSAFSQLQNIKFARMTAEETEKVKEYGRVHLEFCVKLYKIQDKNKLYFLHEHPYAAKSWENEKVKELLESERVRRVKSHMCVRDDQQRQTRTGTC